VNPGKGFQSLGTFQLGRYYVRFGRHPKGKLATSRNQSFKFAKEQHCEISELSSVVSRSELPDHERLLSELPVVSDEELRKELSTDCMDSSATAQELFDPDSIASAIFENDAVYELESDTTMIFGSQDSPPAPVEYTHLDKQFHLGFHGTMHEAFAPVATPASLLRLRTEQYLNIPPSLLSANNSQTPSPVSPVTPSLETAHNTEREHHVNVSPISVTASSYQPVSVLLQQPDEHEYAYSHNGLYHSEPESSFASTQAETSPYSPISCHCQWNHESHRRLTLSPESESFEYIHAEPISLESSILGSEVPWSFTDPHSMRTERTKHTSAWQQYPLLSTNMIETSATHRHWDCFNSPPPPPPTNDINRSDTCFHQRTTANPFEEDASAHTQEVVNVRHGHRYPREKCNICEREFTGK
jgi:hypothetical protein